MRHSLLVPGIVLCAASQLLWLGGCCFRQPHERKLPALSQALRVYPSAEDLEKGDGYVKYQARLPYKSTAVLDFYDHNLRNEGWKKWTLQNDNPGRQWQTIVDATASRPEIVDELFAVWGKTSENRGVGLILREASIHPRMLKPNAEPPQIVQQVTFSLIRLLPGTYEILDNEE